MMHPRVAILISLAEPFLHLAESLSARLREYGVDSQPISVEAFCLDAEPRVQSVYVMSNAPESWRLASSLIRLGVRLMNGEAQVCDMDRRRWKADLSACGARTPEWMSALMPGPLISAWPTKDFPAYLKHADHGAGHVQRFTSQGQLFDFFRLREGTSGPWLIEREVGAGSAQKSYVIGDPNKTFTIQGRSIREQPEMRSISSLIQASCGLRFFSFDYVIGLDGLPSIIDVNRCPVYLDDSDAWRLVARDVVDQLRSTGKLVEPTSPKTPRVVAT